jgi:hypothetical protein
VANLPGLDQGRESYSSNPWSNRWRAAEAKGWPPLCDHRSVFGLLVPDLAPRVGKPQTGRPFVIRIAYSLMRYYGGINGVHAVIGLGCQESTAPGIGAGNG